MIGPELTDRLRREVVEHAQLPPTDRPVVEAWLRHALAYAALERTVLDELTFDVPRHGVVVDPSGETVNDEARALAEVARRMWGVAGPIEDLTRLVESHGGWVYGMTLSPDTAGVFVFDGDIAPAFLVNRRLTPAAETMVLAELYAHFFAHTDPYRAEVVGTFSPSIDAEGRTRRDRARAFARELVMPEADVHALFDGAPVDDPIGLAAGMFDVARSTAADRLERLGYDVGDAPSDEDRFADDRGDRVPERFLRLALEGMHTGRLSVEELAELLDVEPDDAVDLLRLSSSNDDDEGPANGTTEPPSAPRP